MCERVTPVLRECVFRNSYPRFVHGRARTQSPRAERAPARAGITLPRRAQHGDAPVPQDPRMERMREGWKGCWMDPRMTTVDRVPVPESVPLCDCLGSNVARTGDEHHLTPRTPQFDELDRRMEGPFSEYGIAPLLGHRGRWLSRGDGDDGGGGGVRSGRRQPRPCSSLRVRAHDCAHGKQCSSRSDCLGQSLWRSPLGIPTRKRGKLLVTRIEAGAARSVRTFSCSPPGKHQRADHTTDHPPASHG